MCTHFDPMGSVNSSVRIGSVILVGMQSRIRDWQEERLVVSSTRKSLLLPISRLVYSLTDSTAIPHSGQLNMTTSTVPICTLVLRPTSMLISVLEDGSNSVSS